MGYWYEISTWGDPIPCPDMGQWPPSWQARVAKHGPPEKAKEAAIAYRLLAKLVEQHLGYLPEIEIESQGKPYFPQETSLQFSISHTKGCAMAAIATMPIGVDVEVVRPVSTRMMERVAHTDDVDTFFQIWVNREAQGKCLGTGISATGQVLGDPQAIKMVPIEAPKGYKTALAMLP